MFKAGYFFFPFSNKMHLVLFSPICKDNLLSINHSQRLLKSTFKCFFIKLTFLLLKRRQVSSVYSLKSQSVTANFVSFTYKKKSIGPKFSIKNIFYDKMISRLCYFQVSISIFVAYLPFPSSSQEHKSRHDKNIPCRAVWWI